METNDKFFNAYVDLAVGELHKNVNDMLELKTKIKILEDIVREKDQIITTMDATIGVLNEEKKSEQSDVDRLYAEKEQIKNELTEKIETIQKENDKLKEKVKLVEDKYESIQQKSTHMSTFENQIKEMKKELLAKNEEIEQLKKSSLKKIAEINTKNIPVNKKPLLKVETVVDDF